MKSNRIEENLRNTFERFKMDFESTICLLDEESNIKYSLDHWWETNRDVMEHWWAEKSE